MKISIERHTNRQAQVSLLLALPNGTTYQLPGMLYEYLSCMNIARWKLSLIGYIKIFICLRVTFILIELIICFIGSPDTLISNTDGKECFNAGGIKFQLIEAMRKWRIVFNGLAKRTCNGEV